MTRLPSGIDEVTGTRGVVASDATVTGWTTPSPVDADMTSAGDSRPPTPAAISLSKGPLSPGEAFGARYHIIRELGVGGMGAVYQAWDDELGVAVALKLIRPGSDPAAARDLELRFKRELLLARQVTHKNVVRIHDLGEVNGIKYITMTYVEGSDLSQALDASDKLPVERTLAIARQIASGLQAAHEVGIVHRDLKPANIMLEGDTALIMDFGIARSVITPAAAVGAAAANAITLPIVQTAMATASGPRPFSNPANSALTVVGGIVGTIQYMAPEQARAAAVDHRADIYAFGLIVYDMLLGHRRQMGYDSAVNELLARAKEPPPAARTIDPSIPAAVEEILQRCLAVDPADRFQTTAELVQALERLDEHGEPIPEPILRRITPRTATALVVLVLALLTGTFWVAKQASVPPVQPPPTSVLVADFTNATNDPVFSGLVEQALTVGLEGASFVTAYPRRDAMRQAAQLTAGGHLDAPTATLVAISQGVARVVTGSVESHPPRYRLTANLVDPTDNKILRTWTQEASNRDAVLQTVGALAVSVRAGLGDRTANSKQPGADESFTAASLDAARAYTNGQELQWAGKAEAAMAEYKHAIALDPDLGRAYSGLGALADSLGRKQEAEEYYKQALARISRMTEREKFRTRGGYYLLTRNADKARDEFQALVDKFPADTAGLANLALVHFYKRDMNRALEVGRRAVDIYPNNVIRRNNLALFAMYASDFQAADREASEVLKQNPTREKGFVAQAISQAGLGHPDAARATYTRLQQVSDPGRAMAANGLADLALYQGHLAEAATVLQRAMQAENDTFRRARFTVTAAETRLMQGRVRDAAALARQVVNGTTDPGLLFLAGRVLVEAGDEATAAEIGGKLAQRLDTESQMYGGVLDGEIALHKNEPRAAIEKLKAAQSVANAWIVHFDLGRAYLRGEAYAEASSEFDECQKRIGEATSLLLDDVPTVRLTAPLLYYQARAHEGLGSPAAQDNYKQFLAIKQGADEAGLVADARRRLAR